MVALFSFAGVGLRAGETDILRGVDLDLPDDGITVIVGPSGSGKSTLLRLLNGLERPTSGEIQFRGVSLTDVDIRAHRRSVGMVFQRPTIFDGTALDNLRVADPGIARANAVRALERVGLAAELADRNASDLSGGEAQRLCLARTLVTEPAVILMDEPTSALDVDSVHRIEHLAQTIAEEGVRIVWVSHDRDQVRRLATWLVTVENGRITASGEATAMGHVHDDEGFWSTASEAREAEAGSGEAKPAGGGAE